MKKIIFCLLFICAVQAYSQEYTAYTLTASILQELNLSGIPTGIWYYTSLEQALEKYQMPIYMEVRTYRSSYYNDLHYYYSLNHNNYKLSLIRAAILQRYYPYSIIAFIPENQSVNSLLPYREYDFYIADNEFGKLIFSDENKLIYEIAENWIYLNLTFENNNIRKLAILFHNE